MGPEDGGMGQITGEGTKKQGSDRFAWAEANVWSNASELVLIAYLGTNRRS